MSKKKQPILDFSNTQIAFERKSDKALKKMARMFSLMNNRTLVNVGSKLGMLAIKMRLPISTIVKKTIFEQFCGGTTLLECQSTVHELYAHQVQTILDYGAEAKHTEKDFNATMRETIRAIKFANENLSVPVVSCKITGLARFEILEKLQEGIELSDEEQEEYKNAFKRMDSLCHVAHEFNVGIFIDAEESWIQNTIDFFARSMMERYNKEKVIIYNTFQLYRHDRLEFLKSSHHQAKKEGYLLGAKLVRGAYMEKENNRAEEMGYPTPIQPNKQATDDDYNKGIEYCIDNYEEIAMCNASHNEHSAMLMAELISERGLPKKHPHLNFCQLLGMSDHLSFNLAKAGYCVAKYVPYGPVRDVVPYLIRRARENTAVVGDMSRELGFIKNEMKRRKL